MTNASTSGYLLCASPRSGSTLLCDLLTRSGVAGAPASYFRPESIPVYADDWGSDGGRAGWGNSYLEAVRVHGTGDTARFGMRIMWTDMPPFLQRLADVEPGGGIDRERLHSALGVERFVHLSRHDKVAQAVSLVIATQTGLWHRHADGTVREGHEPARRPRYDFDLITDALAMLVGEERGWLRWFSTQSIVPFSLTYEALSSDPSGSTRAVLDHVGANRDDLPDVIATATAKVGTPVNTEWAKRFESERRARDR